MDERSTKNHNREGPLQSAPPKSPMRSLVNAGLVPRKKEMASSAPASQVCGLCDYDTHDAEPRASALCKHRDAEVKTNKQHQRRQNQLNRRRT